MIDLVKPRSYRISVLTSLKKTLSPQYCKQMLISEINYLFCYGSFSDVSEEGLRTPSFQYSLY